MGVNYNKMNSSAFRSGRRKPAAENARDFDCVEKFGIIRPSDRVFHDKFGEGVAITGITSEDQFIRVEFSAEFGVKVIKGSFIRRKQ